MQDFLTIACPHSELCWSSFSRIRTEYGEMRTNITPNTDTFHAVCYKALHRKCLQGLAISVSQTNSMEAMFSGNRFPSIFVSTLNIPLYENMSKYWFFLVRTFLCLDLILIFFFIWTIQSKSPNSVQISENKDQKKNHIQTTFTYCMLAFWDMYLKPAHSWQIRY